MAPVLSARGSRRQGRVVDRDGHPVPESFVSVVWGTTLLPEIALVTDEEGRFALRLPDGRFRLKAVGPGGRAGEVECVSPGDEEIVLRLGE